MTPTHHHLFVVALLVIIASTRIEGASFIEKQLACSLDAGPCDKFGQEVKDALPEIIGNNCAACNRNQSIRARRIAEFLQENYPVEWNLLVQKYGNREQFQNY